MSKISAIVLYGQKRDEIDVCLQTADFCHEIIVVDFSVSGISSSLIKKYNLKVKRCTHTDSFSQLRNAGAKEAGENWLFYLDTDERVTPALAKEISSSIIHHPSSINAFSIPRKNYYLGKRFKNAGAWPDKVVRLIASKALIKWEGIIHEQPKIRGKIGQIKEPLIHLSHQNIEQMALKTINWSKLEAELRLQANHPKMSSWRFWRILCTSFWDNFVKKKACFEGTEGVIEGIFQVFSTFFTYVRLWEKQQKPSPSDIYKEIDGNILKKWQIKK